MKRTDDLLFFPPSDVIYEARATREFNRVARNTRIASYFDKAIATLFPEEKREMPVFDYVVPGTKPKGEIERWVYDSILQKIKLEDQDARLERSMRVLWSLLLTHESMTEGNEHVNRRQESTV